MIRNSNHCLYSHFDVCVTFVRVIIHVVCEFQIVRMFSRNILSHEVRREGMPGLLYYHEYGPDAGARALLGLI